MTTTPTAPADLPEALRLAEELDGYTPMDPGVWPCREAAAELRRLHALSAAAPAAPAVMDGTVPPSPINLWLVTEQDGKRYTVHRHSMASELARDTQYPCKVEALQTMGVDVPAYTCCNSWFVSLPEGRQAVLRDDKWMLAHAAFDAGRALAPQAQQPDPAMESVLVDGIDYPTPSPVAAELLRLHIELQIAARAGAQAVPNQDHAKRLIGDVVQADELASAVCRTVAELPDRDSPADWPEAMLVTSDELHRIVREAIFDATPAAVSAPSVPEAVAKDAARYRHLRSRENSLETQQRDTGVFNGSSCYQSVGGVMELKSEEELDAAIDAAMLAATPAAPAQAVPIAWYTDWPGCRVYADEPHGWDEPGLHLSGSNIADHWSPLYSATPAAVSAPSVPEGWKLVPVAANSEMRDAAWSLTDAPSSAWAAMLAAAPQAPAAEGSA